MYGVYVGEEVVFVGEFEAANRIARQVKEPGLWVRVKVTLEKPAPDAVSIQLKTVRRSFVDMPAGRKYYRRYRKNVQRVTLHFLPQKDGFKVNVDVQ